MLLCAAIRFCNKIETCRKACRLYHATSYPTYCYVLALTRLFSKCRVFMQQGCDLLPGTQNTLYFRCCWDCPTYNMIGSASVGETESSRSYHLAVMPLKWGQMLMATYTSLPSYTSQLSFDISNAVKVENLLNRSGAGSGAPLKVLPYHVAIDAVTRQRNLQVAQLANPRLISYVFLFY